MKDDLFILLFGLDAPYTIGYIFIILLLGIFCMPIIYYTKWEIIAISEQKDCIAVPIKKNSLYRYIDKQGKCMTDLKPIGRVKVNDAILDCLSLNGYIEQGTSILITECDDRYVYVKKI